MEFRTSANTEPPPCQQSWPGSGHSTYAFCPVMKFTVVVNKWPWLITDQKQRLIVQRVFLWFWYFENTSNFWILFVQLELLCLIFFVDVLCQVFMNVVVSTNFKDLYLHPPPLPNTLLDVLFDHGNLATYSWVVNDRNGISPKPNRNRNMDFLPNRNRTETETQYRNYIINIFRVYLCIVNV